MDTRQHTPIIARNKESSYNCANLVKAAASVVSAAASHLSACALTPSSYSRRNESRLAWSRCKEGTLVVLRDMRKRYHYLSRPYQTYTCNTCAGEIDLHAFDILRKCSKKLKKQCAFLLEPLLKFMSHLEQAFRVHVCPGSVLLRAVLPVFSHYLFVPRPKQACDEARSCRQRRMKHEDRKARHHFLDSVDDQVDTPKKMLELKSVISVCCFSVVALRCFFTPVLENQSDTCHEHRRDPNRNLL